MLLLTSFELNEELQLTDVISSQIFNSQLRRGNVTTYRILFTNSKTIDSCVASVAEAIMVMWVNITLGLNHRQLRLYELTSNLCEMRDARYCVYS